MFLTGHVEVDRKKYLSEWRKSMQYKQRKAIVRKKKSAANKNKIMENVNGNQEDTIQSYSYKNNGRMARSKQIVGQKKDTTTTTTENNKKKKGRSSAPSLMTVSTDHTSTMDTCSSNGNNNNIGGSTGSNVDGNQTSELSVAQLKRELHALHVTHIPKTLCTKVALSKVYETLRVSGIAYVNIEPFKTPELDGSDNDESDQENSAGEDDTTSEH